MNQRRELNIFLFEFIKRNDPEGNQTENNIYEVKFGQQHWHNK